MKLTGSSRTPITVTSVVCMGIYIYLASVYVFIARRLSKDHTMEGNVSGIAVDMDENIRNETTVKLQITQVKIYMTVLQLAIGVTGVVGNLLVVIVILRYKKLFQQVKSNIINQSVIDCLASVMLIQIAILRSIGVPQALRSDALFCKLVTSQLLLWAMVNSSTLNLMAISIERYLAIVHSMSYRIRYSKAKANAVVAFIWLFGLLYTSAYIIPTSGILRGTCMVVFFWPSRLFAAAFGLVQIVITLILPIVVHSMCYLSIVKILRKRKIKVGPKDVSRNKTNTCTNTGQEMTLSNVDQMPSTSALSDVYTTKPIQSTASNTKKDSDNKASRNVIKTFAIVTTSYFVCWVPHKVYILMYMFGQISTFGHVYQATLIMMFLNCCINPFIYVAKYAAFRKGMAMLFRCLQQHG